MTGEWLAGALERLGLEGRGEPEPVRETAWSYVARVPTSEGPVWFKRVAQAVRHEVAVTEALAAIAPELVLAPLASDAALGLMLLPDGGETLRARPVPGRWEVTLARYAELQLASAPHAAKLLALGALDRRPEALPGLLDALPGVETVRHLAPRLIEACVRLGALPVTIEHDDLHDGNVFHDGRIFDWGDAGVAHPFFTCVISLQEEPARVRDAYLEPWTALAPRAELLELLDDALWVGCAARALTWAEILTRLGGETRREHWQSVEKWLALYAAGGIDLSG